MTKELYAERKATAEKLINIMKKTLDKIQNNKDVWRNSDPSTGVFRTSYCGAPLPEDWIYTNFKDIVDEYEEDCWSLPEIAVIPRVIANYKNFEDGICEEYRNAESEYFEAENEEMKRLLEEEPEDYADASEYDLRDAASMNLDYSYEKENFEHLYDVCEYWLPELLVDIKF